jgi:hypothetical protein
MKNLITALVLLLPLMIHHAFATPTHGRVSNSCKHQARDMKGDERKEFMNACNRKRTVQQAARNHGRASSCSSLAMSKRGDERKDFLRKCRERYR